MVKDLNGCYSRPDVDKGRQPLSEIHERVAQLIKDKLGINNREELKNKLNEIFECESVEPKVRKKIEAVKEFFLTNPNAWFDFIRKLHKSKKEKPEKHSSGMALEDTENPEKPFDDVSYGNIAEVLLIQGRKADSGRILSRALSDILQRNDHTSKLIRSRLHRLSENQKSFLDVSGRSMLSIKKSRRKDVFQKLITNALVQNIEDCNDGVGGNVENHFLQVFPKIIYYLGKIYNKNYKVRITGSTSILGLATTLAESFSNDDYGDAWMIIQSFYAWANIIKILEMCERAENFCKPSTFCSFFNNEQGLNTKPRLTIFGEVKSETSPTGVTVYSAKCSVKDTECEIKWRAKSVESILQKMSQKEDYNNFDTLKDTVGISLILPDKLTSDERLEVLRETTDYMADFGYILKDKEMLTPTEHAQVQGEYSDTAVKSDRKRPIKITREKHGNTLGDVNNISVSGFMGIPGKKPLGVEWQIFTESAYQKKVDDDLFYKIRGGLEGLDRGPKYLLPHEIALLLEGKFGQEGRRNESIIEMIKELIKKGFLIPYLSQGKYIIFSYKSHQKAIEADMRKSITKIDLKNTTDTDKLWQYIENYDDFRRNALYTTSRTSSPPPSPDQSGPTFSEKGHAKPSL